MFVGSRVRMISLVLSLGLSAGALAGCEKKTQKPDPAQAGPSKASVKQAHSGLQKQLAGLQKTVSTLRQQFDALPHDLPGFEELRAKQFAMEEVLGVTAARVTWLATRIDAPAASPEELQQLSKDIAATHDEMTEVTRVAVEVTHQMAPLQRLAALAATGAALPFQRALPTGYQVKGAAGGLERRLLDFIEDPERKADKTSWLDFDASLFANGSAELDREHSKAQLENVSEILKAYPRVKLRIGSYTDNTGAAADNKKLSTERARAVSQELIRLGVNEARLAAEGFGADNPVCAANDTDSCKAKNRRTAILVIAK